MPAPGRCSAHAEGLRGSELTGVGGDSDGEHPYGACRVICLNSSHRHSEPLR